MIRRHVSHLHLLNSAITVSRRKAKSDQHSHDATEVTVMPFTPPKPAWMLPLKLTSTSEPGSRITLPAPSHAGGASSAANDPNATAMAAKPTAQIILRKTLMSNRRVEPPNVQAQPPTLAAQVR